MSKKVTFEADGISVAVRLGSQRNPNHVQVYFLNPNDPTNATGYTFGSKTLASESDANIISTVQSSAEFAKGLTSAKQIFATSEVE